MVRISQLYSSYISRVSRFQCARCSTHSTSDSSIRRRLTTCRRSRWSSACCSFQSFSCTIATSPQLQLRHQSRDAQVEVSEARCQCRYSEWWALWLRVMPLAAPAAALSQPAFFAANVFHSLHSAPLRSALPLSRLFNNFLFRTTGYKSACPSSGLLSVFSVFTVIFICSLEQTNFYH